MTTYENNIEKPLELFLGKIETKSIIIYGDPGSGKTQLSWLLTLGYKRIYSNVNYYKNGKRINEEIRFMSDIKKMKFDTTPGILILDEAGVNNNSRRSMSNDNIEYGNLSRLQRKLNVYVVWIAQQDFTFDKVQRLGANLILNCYGIDLPNGGFMVNVTREKRIKGTNNFIFDAERNINVIAMMKRLGYTYNQLDESIIIGSKKTEKQKKGKKEKQKT